MAELDIIEFPDGTQHQFRDSRVDNLPDPMVYRGTLGTGGTIQSLPVDGSARVGDTYKVITAGIYAGQDSDIGDMFICHTKTESANTWDHVPSGDDPGVNFLEDLIDVDITTPTNGQVLTYDSANDKWINTDASGGSTVQNFEVTVSRPNNPTAISVEITASGTIVYDEDISCTVYGAFNETTDSFTYDGNEYTVIMQGIQATRDQIMFTISINGTPYNIICRSANSSYAQTDTFIITAAAPITASGVSYDNATSGLTATDVQGAIDEVVANSKGTAEALAKYHLGFYLDENGGLCQVNEI